MMNANRKTAIIVGALFIIGTVAGILSLTITQPILDVPDYLNRVAANQNQIILGAVFVLVMGFSLALVPVFMFPVLKKHEETCALGYLVFRGALETFHYFALVICWLILIPLSQEYVKAGIPDATYFQTLGKLLLEGSAAISTSTQIVFPLGALIFYYGLFRSNLIPRWLSGWGFIAAILWLATTLFDLFLFFGSWSHAPFAFALPIALQEMVMAVWLIVKGFNPAVTAPESA
jgi:hypothetical protein